MPLFLILLSTVTIYVLGRFKFSTVVRLKPLIIPAGCAVFIAGLMIFSKTALSAALNGISLWLQVVLPSVFPFLVASQLVIKSGTVKIFGTLLEPFMRPLFNLPGESSLALAMGLTCGYPVGAKITSDLRNSRFLSQNEGSRLLAFSNNASPLFITGAVGTALFGSPKAGFLLLGCQLAAAMSVGIISGLLSRKKYSDEKNLRRLDNSISTQTNKSANLTYPVEKPAGSFSILLGNSIVDSLNTMIMVGGFMILFSVVIGLLSEAGLIELLSGLLAGVFKKGGEPALFESLLRGFFEIVTGISGLSKSDNLSPSLIMAATSLILGWSGLSVHFQVMSVISKTDLQVKTYLLGKLFQSVLSAAYCFLITSLPGFSGAFAHTKTVFNLIENSSEYSLNLSVSLFKWLSVVPVLIFFLSLLHSQFKQDKNMA